MTQPQANTAVDAQAVAVMNADVGAEHVADVYAAALLGAAESAGATAAALEEFDSWIADVLAANPKLEAVLASALVSHEEKAAILDRIFAKGGSKLFLNFLKVVSRHGRLDLIRPIHRQAHAMYDKQRGMVRVTITTAAPVDAALGAKIAEQLRKGLGAEPIVTQSVDPSLIGGMVVRVGDTVYDGSIANQLEDIRQQMLDRSAHEIQSRRDRFGYPAGN